MQANRNHDERAALVCLLTAACVARGRFTVVGEASGGYFFLPPWSLWKSWAKDQITDWARKETLVEIWTNGSLLKSP